LKNKRYLVRVIVQATGALKCQTTDETTLNDGYL
jgi:hypothetical protein